MYMTELSEPDRIGEFTASRRKEVKVVDLSERPARDIRGPLHQAILKALGRTASGVLTKEELLEAAKDHTPSDLEQALRDLSLKGLVQVIWRTPFRFMALLTRGRASPDAQPRVLSSQLA